MRLLELRSHLRFDLGARREKPLFMFGELSLAVHAALIEDRSVVALAYDHAEKKRALDGVGR